MGAGETPVLIAGAGPVGMTLALELANHGIGCTILERNETTTRHPKMDLTNGRSMELFRRLGIADDLRAVGVSAAAPLDIVWATSATGHVLHRFAYPSPDGSRDRTRVANDGSGTIEPSLRVSQIVLEPVLKAKIDGHPLIDVRFGWAYEAFEQDESGVTTRIRHRADDAVASIRSRYLVGCDGGGSRVRNHANIALEGEHGLFDAFMVHFRSVDLRVLAKFGIAYHLQTAAGTVIAQNGTDIWTLQTSAPIDSDPNALLRQFTGADFDYEILVANPWTPHVVLADRYRDGRVFLAGDAAHQFIPTGGYGMNTGIGDAVDLGWKLAAVENGWGGEILLDSYEVERRQIAIQNRAASLRHLEVRAEINQLINNAAAQGDLDAGAASARRLALGRRIAALGNIENESWGIEHGFRYENSPIVCDDGAPWDFDPRFCRPGTVPGVRLPHVFLADGRALFDLLARDFTLIVIGPCDPGDIEACAGDFGFAVQLVRLDDEPVLELLQMKLLLVRPDQHVAWRGDVAPRDWRAVLTTACGRQVVRQTQDFVS